MEKMEGRSITDPMFRDVRVLVHDGKMHPVDSNDISFKIAGMMAFKDAFLKAEPRLLEPIAQIENNCSRRYCWRCYMGDLRTRRSMIMGIDTKGRYQVIKARTPLAELDRYSTTLRSLSQGRGTFIQRVDNYEPVPTETSKAGKAV